MGNGAFFFSQALKRRTCFPNGYEIHPLSLIATDASPQMSCVKLVHGFTPVRTQEDKSCSWPHTEVTYIRQMNIHIE